MPAPSDSCDSASRLPTAFARVNDLFFIEKLRVFQMIAHALLQDGRRSQVIRNYTFIDGASTNAIGLLESVINKREFPRGIAVRFEILQAQEIDALEIRMEHAVNISSIDQNKISVVVFPDLNDARFFLHRNPLAD